MAMHEADGGNAMTEVALALAMAFFSISILALVSMGAGGATPKQVLEAALAIDSNQEATPEEPAADHDDAAPDPVYIFYWQGRYFDKSMEETTPAALATNGPAILVFPPDLAFETVMNIRQTAQQYGTGKDPAIAQMSPEWVSAFQQKEP